MLVTAEEQHIITNRPSHESILVCKFTLLKQGQKLPSNGDNVQGFNQHPEMPQGMTCHGDKDRDRETASYVCREGSR